MPGTGAFQEFIAVHPVFGFPKESLKIIRDIYFGGGSQGDTYWNRVPHTFAA